MHCLGLITLPSCTWVHDSRPAHDSLEPWRCVQIVAYSKACLPSSLHESIKLLIACRSAGCCQHLQDQPNTVVGSFDPCWQLAICFTSCVVGSMYKEPAVAHWFSRLLEHFNRTGSYILLHACKEFIQQCDALRLTCASDKFPHACLCAYVGR